MNSKLKKSLSLLVSLVMLLSVCTVGFTAFGAGDIEINSSNFEDDNFRALISKRYDTKEPYGVLSEAERANVYTMSVTGMKTQYGLGDIKSLKGIEFFADTLQVLRCGNIGLESLDVSQLTNLTSLTCMGNSIESLDVSNNSELLTLNCSENQITSLNLGSIKNITQLHCYTNKLESIDVSNLADLDDFRCDQNELTSLDVTNNTALLEFACVGNHLTSLDLSHNTELGEDITTETIGNQTLTKAITTDGYNLFVPVSLDSTRLTYSSIAKDGSMGYSNGNFTPEFLEDVKDGIDYNYSTGLGTGDDMDVHITLTRDFYSVEIYAETSLISRLGVVYAQPGKAAPEYTIEDMPQCKTFVSWSKDVSAVNEDMKVSPVYKDSHSYSPTAFYRGVVTVTCSVCSTTLQYKFADSINAKAGDSNYVEALDVQKDGVINAKDYAKLIKMFK